MVESKHILHLAVSIGEVLLKNGGEIYRVQETVTRILEAYEIKDYNVYVVSNGIFATVNEWKKDASSMVRYIPLGETNLGKISFVNQISRELCEHKCTIGEAQSRLSFCEKMPSAGIMTRMLAAGMGCMSFCYIFGGRPADCMIAGILGMLLQSYIYHGSKRGTSKFITNIIGSGMVTAGSLFFSWQMPWLLQDKVVSASIIILLPGVALTTSIRELFNGDYLSGGIRLMDALLTACCIAVGVGAAIKGWQLLSGGIF